MITLPVVAGDNQIPLFLNSLDRKKINSVDYDEEGSIQVVAADHCLDCERNPDGTRSNELYGVLMRRELDDDPAPFFNKLKTPWLLSFES